MMSNFQKQSSSQYQTQINNNLIAEEYSFFNDFTQDASRGIHSQNDFNHQNLQNPLSNRQKPASSMSMIDENSNTIPFFQKRHSMKNTYSNQNDLIFQNKMTNSQRMPFEEVVSLQPQQIIYSQKSVACEDQQNMKQSVKFPVQINQNQQQSSTLNHYSNDLSPIDMTFQQISTQSSSPDFDLAVIKNPSSSQNVNISNKSSSFVGSGSVSGMSSFNQMSNNQQKSINQSSQQQGIAKDYKNYSQSGNSMQELSSISTRVNSYSTNASSGLNKNKSSNYTFQEEQDENSQACSNIIDQMDCQEVEDFSLYIQEYEKQQGNSNQGQMRKQAISQDDIYQEQLFGNNPLYVPKYGYQIVQNLFKQQKNYKVTVITDPRELLIRENLIDLMSRLHTHLKLQEETLYLSVNIFARYLDVQKQNYQNQKIVILVATCLFIAAKYQEIYPPPLRDFLTVLKLNKIQASTSDICDLEGSILNKLNFSLFGPTRLQFLEAYFSQITLDPSQVSFCYYLLELTNLNHSFYKYDHSEIAAACILLSEKFKNISGKYFWSEKLEKITNYQQQDVYECVEELYQYLVNVGHNRKKFFIYSKYSEQKYKSVALIDYDLTHNVNNQSSQESAQDGFYICTSNNPKSENSYSQQQKNYTNKQMTQSQQLSQSCNQGNMGYNNSMSQSTYNMTYSQNSQNYDSQQLQEQQYYSKQMSQQSNQLAYSKCKSECYVDEYDENSINFNSQVRQNQQNVKYDISKYSKIY
ncbi:hypothetical protein ABPG74_014196 [Tetrahymena malaccensis]